MYTKHVVVFFNFFNIRIKIYVRLTVLMEFFNCPQIIYFSPFHFIFNMCNVQDTVRLVLIQVMAINDIHMMYTL